jgi:hypothetical protein
MNNVFLDIETIPCQDPAYREAVRHNLKPPGNIKKADSIAAWLAENGDAAVEEAVAKTSFDPAHGHICCIGWAIGDGEALSLSAKDVEAEKAILANFFDCLPKMGMVKVIGHNVAAFDLRFLLCRAIVLGVPIPRCIPRDIKPWAEGIFDTMTAWAGPRGTIGQDRLAKALGLAGKGDFDGSMVAAAWLAGEHEKIAQYCRDDVETVRAIYRRFEAVDF